MLNLQHSQYVLELGRGYRMYLVEVAVCTLRLSDIHVDVIVLYQIYNARTMSHAFKYVY